MSQKRVLITGGCGFIGHHFVEHFLKTTDWDIIIFDKLTYASSGFDRVRDIGVFNDNRVLIFTVDLNQPIEKGILTETGPVNYILHLAAETHVDNSIANPAPFVMSNVVGTMYILEFAKHCESLEAFHYFSTDEVFGPAPPGVNYSEWNRYNSTNPYSASKAGGEELCLAYANTYGLPVFVTHTMNCMGERQHPEKFIPICIKRILSGQEIQIHANADETVSGSRFYIHCRNVADAVSFLLDRFISREKYNIVGEKEVSNLDLAQAIADIIGKPLHYRLVDFHSSRPGHDLRYGLNGSRMSAMGWDVPLTFEKSLEKTVSWTLDNQKWLFN